MDYKIQNLKDITPSTWAGGRRHYAGNFSEIL